MEDAATNSASAVERTTISWHFDFHATAAPFNMSTCLVVHLRVRGRPAQSESTKSQRILVWFREDWSFGFVNYNPRSLVPLRYLKRCFSASMRIWQGFETNRECSKPANAISRRVQHDKHDTLSPGRNRLSAESWLEGEIVSENWICGAGKLGFRISLQPWHSFLNRFAEVASCPEGCLAQLSSLDLGLVPELLIPVPWGVGRGNGTLNSVVE